MNQAQLDFTVHKRENSPESQRHLDANRSHFNRKCQQVFDLLMAGGHLTVLGAANAGIASLPRRIADLRNQGVRISDFWENGCKTYHMTACDRAANRAELQGLAA